MAITNLNGTKWLLPLTVLFDQQAPFHGANINFTSNGVNYAYLDVGDEQNAVINYGTDSSTLTLVYDGGVWADNDYRVVTITGGDDVTDEYVIDWFTTTATDITPNVMLKDGSGTALTYSNVSQVALENAEGGITKFSLPPTAQLNVVENGVYDTLQYNSVNVNVSGGGAQGYTLTKGSARGTIYYIKSDGTTGTATAQGTYSDVVFCFAVWGMDIQMNSGHVIAMNDGGINELLSTNLFYASTAFMLLGDTTLTIERSG